MSEFRGLKCACRVVLLFLLVTSSALQQKAASAEQKTARYFESVRNQPSLLTDFLKQMPKGGDLHNNLSGAIYAQTFVKCTVERGLIIDGTTSSFVPTPCNADDPLT